MKKSWFAGLLCAGLIAAPSLAATIDDASYFDGLQTTLIDFETDGAGNPLSISDGGAQLMPADAYASQGVTFSTDIAWVNDAGVDFDNALTIGGSPVTGIPGSLFNAFEMTFDSAVDAFGFWVVSNTADTNVVFEAYDANDALIESVSFEGSLVDGTVGIASYGFMGISSDAGIKSVSITKQAAVLDNLRFGVVPEPATGILLALAGLGLLRRR